MVVGDISLGSSSAMDILIHSSDDMNAAKEDKVHEHARTLCHVSCHGSCSDSKMLSPLSESAKFCYVSKEVSPNRLPS